MTEVKLLEGAESFLYPGNETGCLIVHALTGSPHDVHWLGQYLNQQGYAIYGPRLAGHGTTPEDLARITCREWYADVLAGYRMLRSQCRRVFGLGVSLGGILCLLLASREEVDGVVAMATPHQFSVGWRWPLLRIMSLTGGMFSNPPIPPEQDEFVQRILAEQRARGEKPLGRVSYTKEPARSYLEGFSLLDEMRAALPSISVPLLFIHARRDHVVPIEHMLRNYESAGSSDKQMMVLESDRHGISEHPDIMGSVFKAAADFIAAHS